MCLYRRDPLVFLAFWSEQIQRWKTHEDPEEDSGSSLPLQAAWSSSSPISSLVSTLCVCFFVINLFSVRVSDSSFAFRSNIMSLRSKMNGRRTAISIDNNAAPKPYNVPWLAPRNPPNPPALLLRSPSGRRRRPDPRHQLAACMGVIGDGSLLTPRQL